MTPDPGSLYTGQFETSEIDGSRQEGLLTANTAWSPDFEMHPENLADLDDLVKRAAKNAVRRPRRPRKD